MPVTNRTAQTAGRLSCGASTSWEVPKPTAPTSTTSSRVRPIVARIIAPHSAPPPNTDAISPNVPAPWSSVSLATSGSSTSKLNENVETSRTVKNVTATRRELTANESASPTPASTLRCGPRAGRPWSEAHGEDRADHDRVADRVQREGDARACGGDDEAADRGADDARRRAEPGAQGDGVRQVVPADDLEHERVPGRRVERDRDALDEAEHVELPHRDHAREREHGEQRGVHRQHRLAGDDHPPQVDPVGDRAADERERGHGQRLDERERSHRDRGVRELEHEPVRSDLLHPGADERDAAAGEVEPVVAVAPQAAEGAVAERGERGDRVQLSASLRARAGRRDRSARRARRRSRPARSGQSPWSRQRRRPSARGAAPPAGRAGR